MMEFIFAEGNLTQFALPLGEPVMQLLSYYGAVNLRKKFPNSLDEKTAPNQFEMLTERLKGAVSMVISKLKMNLKAAKRRDLIEGWVGELANTTL